MSEAVQQVEDPSSTRVLFEARIGSDCRRQVTADGITTYWVSKGRLIEALRFLRTDIERPFAKLFDLSAIDERLREHRPDQPNADFTVFYHLMSLERNEDIRLKVALQDTALEVPSAVGVYVNANWYEREAYDMFGIQFTGHPNLRRILTPPLWEGHPLRKEHPARATEMDPGATDAERVLIFQRCCVMPTVLPQLKPSQPHQSMKRPKMTLVGELMQVKTFKTGELVMPQSKVAPSSTSHQEFT